MTTIKFGTDGWRDLMYDRFNLPNVLRVVRAVARYVIDHRGQERGVVVGYDARFFSDFFAREAARMFSANGIKAYIGERDYPTPVIAFAVKQLNAFGAVMFTASHNPPEYNGIKFIPEYAGPAMPEITGEIEANLAGETNFEKTPVSGDNSLLVNINPTEAYLGQLRALVDTDRIIQAGLNIYIDPMYASGRGFLRQLLAGSAPTEIHGRKDPLFNGAMPDPQEKLLGDLKTRVSGVPNSIGLATDGDADRFGIIDSDGSYLTPNQVITLLLDHLIKNKGMRGVAVRTVATTHMIDRLAELYGVKVIETPVGFKYIGEMMRTGPVIIGGEESGGLSVAGHLPEKDGILACALMAELRAVSGVPLMETLKEVQSRIGNFFTQRIDLRLSDEAKAKALLNLKMNPPARVGGKAVVETRTVDGFKFILADGSWFLARPSGTEPLIRIYFEAHSRRELEEMAGEARQLVEG